jgi:hypothetical protein
MSTYLELLANGNWVSTSGYEDFAALPFALQAEPKRYHESFMLALAYLRGNPTSRVHSTELTAAVQAENPGFFFTVSESAVVSAALSTQGGFGGVPGSVKTSVLREDGERVWEDVGGIWLTKP